MAKRFATMFFIMIGVVIFLISAFLLVLFISPGARIFGIKYIMINTHAVKTGKVSIDDTFALKYGDRYFSGSIIVNSDEVPVNVQFTSSGTSFYYEYYDNYNGITSSEMQDPSLSVERDDQGNAVFTVNSFKTFVYKTSSSKRYLKLYIPLANIYVNDAQNQNFVYGEANSGASKKYQYDLTINTGNADINFNSTETARIPSFKNINISTEGVVKYNGTHIKALTFSIKTNKTTVVSSSVLGIVNAKNYNIECTSGRVVVGRPLGGDLSVKTKNGNIYINKCNNLKVETDLGDILTETGRAIEVNGIADIKTIAGSVYIDIIRGDGQNKIETGSGDVCITSIKNGTISTHRGTIEINTLNNMQLSSNVGSIYVNKVLSNVEVETKRGKIVLGTEKTTVNNFVATSVIGDIKIENSIGKAVIETIDSNVDFKNQSSDIIKIVCGGKLNAQKLKGIVEMELYGESYLDFEDISAQTTIKLKDSCKFVEVKALNTQRSKLYYLITGTPASIYESNNSALGSYSLKQQESSAVYGDERRGIKFTIMGDSVSGLSNAVVDVYFDKSGN